MFNHPLRIMAGVALLALACLPGPAAFALSPSDKTEVETVIRNYLLEHPEIIKEAIENLEKKQAVQASEAATQAITQRKATIFDSKHQAVMGNPSGDVTLVEFFDYNCGYCRKALDDVNALIAGDKQLRVVLKEFPILSRGSMEAAQIAVAVRLQSPERYSEFHNGLFGSRAESGKGVGREQALAVAKAMKLDMTRLEADVKSPETQASLDEVYELARVLSVNGTPAFVLGEEVLHGAVGAEEIKQKIDAVRACGKTIC